MNHEHTNTSSQPTPRHHAIWDLVTDHYQVIDTADGIYVFQR